MTTTVVNIYHDEYDVYIGRNSRFGNKFRIGKDGNRDQVIAKYRRWLWNRLKNDVKFEQAINELRGKRLGCYCAPKPCHGDVIKAYLDWRFGD